MKCKKNNKYKLLGFILIILFSFLFIDNVNATAFKCTYYLEKNENDAGVSFHGRTLRADSSSEPLIFQYDDTADYNCVMTHTDIEGEKHLDKGRVSLAGHTYCPKSIIGTGTEVMFHQIFRSAHPEYVDSNSKWTIVPAFDTYVGLYNFEKKYSKTKYDWTSRHRVYYLENSNVVRFREQLNTLNKYYKELGIISDGWFPKVNESTDCSLDSIEKIDSTTEEKIKKEFNKIDVLDKAITLTDTIITEANDAEKGRVTPDAWSKPHTLSQFANSDLPTDDYPAGYKLPDLINDYKFRLEEGGFTAVNNISNCITSNASRLNKTAKKTKGLDKKTQEFIEKADEKSKEIKDKLKLIHKKKKNAEKKEQEEFKDCKSIFNKEVLDFIKWIYIVIEIGAIALTVVLGMLDFTKAVAVSEDGATKKAGIKFLKRLIAVVIIFLLPTLINFILSVFNLKEPLGIDDKCIEMSD